MAYNKEDLYVLGLMARDAAKDGSLSEYQKNEYEVFAAMATDKENNQPEVITMEDKAKTIFTRVSEVLSSFENVSAVCQGKVQNGSASNGGEQMVIDLCAMGYYYPTDRTNFAETKHVFSTEIARFKENGQLEKAEALSVELAKVEEGMMNAAIPVIVEGLQDGSIDENFALKTDEEIVDSLINSDNSKEIQIQNAFEPIMKNAFIQEANIVCASNDEAPVE